MTTTKPLLIELFAGLHGWGIGAVAEGYRVIGFDLFDMCRELGQPRPDGDIQLVLQDVLTLHGAQFKDAALIVASPPCQAYSYMAMPWSRAKQMVRDYETGVRDRAELTGLFDACFRIQREASAAVGHHIPLVVENVRGAQKWVGRARYHFRSFYLWGDIPALMPIPKDGEAVKVGGLDWNDRTRTGQAFNTITITRERLEGRKSTPGGADGWFGDYEAMKEGIKQRGSGREWFAGDGKISRTTSSKSHARKRAAAEIARIPLPLARHIARAWYPPDLT